MMDLGLVACIMVRQAMAAVSATLHSPASRTLALVKSICGKLTKNMLSNL